MTEQSQSSASVNRCVRLQPSVDGLLTVWIDTPERNVNVFDAAMIEALECAVDHIKANQDVYQAVVFRSKKGCFFVGADVQAIAKIGSESEAEAAVKRGQDLMSSIEGLPIPTVAAIDGPCLGGGLELALACDFRLARSNARTKLALPEIKLGLIPGWGGTQRLPQLIGLRRALEMILKGKALSSVDAQRISLVDFVFADDVWDESVLYFCKSLATDSELQDKPWRKERRNLRDWLLDCNSVGRQLVLRTAKKSIASQQAHYPALFEAFEAARHSLRTDGAAYVEERDAFVRLLFTDTARSLLALFQQRDRARKARTWVTAEGKKPIRRIAVIGAGAMGAGIGALAASKGYEVVFKEIHDGAAEAGRKRTYDIMRKQADRGKISMSEMQEALARMEFTSAWEDTADCDLAIEAVLEIEAVKKEVFQELDRRLRPDAVLASNTSSLCVTRLGSGMKRRQQIAGLHFFNPVQKMELVEVVRTEATDDETMSRLVGFVNSLGKTPIVTSDKPGFLVNRVLFPYLGEAVRMVAEGVEVAKVDRQMRQFGMPMGPLQLLDQVGIDIASHVADSLASVLPDSDDIAAFLRNMMDHGWLGKKSGIGFYSYQDGKEFDVNNQLPQDAVAPRLGLDFHRDGMTSIQRRLVLPLLNEAVHCLDELVVTDPWMIDLGIVLGTGFAPMHGGPLRLIDSIGQKAVLKNLESLANAYGDRFAPADGLVLASRRKDKFFGAGVSAVTGFANFAQPEINASVDN